ncbi:MAG: gamma carbonic anhydrase family protein [Candidatus Izemoplasmatales bacterium]|uniref:Gamma carbonic anhydrase family protein n=1 Tax=Hujiaoplasma nucleasis TaxID=2725268 RepID=A0A7L6N3A2_9MOLU|nr:gamma carbonic anhydrase family protein [Hujiaoplasma nucleasis]QLY39932.1 gamma carbonic anhydrase family protein [Hujiaoplasma nucleasis]
MKYLDTIPQLDPSVKNIGGQIVGQVKLEKNVNVWFHASIRGDMCPIHIKEGTNIQDNAVVHTNTNAPTTIGKYVTVGHSAIVHACSVGDYALIGMGSILLDHCEIGDYAMVAAGTVVPPRKKVPPRHLVMGNPMRIVRELTDEEIQANINNSKLYIDLANKYSK